jgi:SP family sugar:H+ symporter-like MFS transporter
MSARKPPVGYVTRIAAAAAGGGFLFGFDTSTMNAAIPGISETLQLSSGAVGFVAAVALLGCAVGAWSAGPVSGKLGRTRVMLIAGTLISAGSLGAVFAGNLVLLGILRVMTGIGIGSASAVVPAYIAEITPAPIRGRTGSLWQFAIVIGQFLGLVAGFVLANLAGSEAATLPWGGAAWRSMFAVVAALGAIYLLTALKLPASPNDLIRRRDNDTARAQLDRLGFEDPDGTLGAIRTSVETAGTGSVRDLRGPRLGLKGIVWIGILLAAFQQLVGISVVKTYSNTLWQAVGFSTSNSFTISMVTVGISIVSTIIAIAIMDKIGRRTLLISGAAVMAVSLAVLALCFAAATTGADGQPSLSQSASTGALISINVFAVAFGITWGPVTWLMLSELFDSDLRTSAVAVATAANWLTNWLVVRTFPVLAGMGLGLAYGFYAAFAVIALFFALKTLPETRGRKMS